MSSVLHGNQTLFNQYSKPSGLGPLVFALETCLFFINLTMSSLIVQTCVPDNLGLYSASLPPIFTLNSPWEMHPSSSRELFIEKIGGSDSSIRLLYIPSFRGIPESTPSFNTWWSSFLESIREPLSQIKGRLYPSYEAPPTAGIPFYFSFLLFFFVSSQVSYYSNFLAAPLYAIPTIPTPSRPDKQPNVGMRKSRCQEDIKTSTMKDILD